MWHELDLDALWSERLPASREGTPWLLDRGIPTEASLAKMRAMGASFLVGTPKGRLTRL